MDSNTAFSSPRTDSFPVGLRVLVVDDDPTWLKILEKMLKKCSYEVTTCGLAREALDLLRERKDGFDIVISDVNMPDMDGFKLLENVGLEMDLPVIMMSVDGETSRVMKGVQHGACDYLLKPIRMKELRNIWQHVFRKRIHEVRDIENPDGIDEFQIMRNGLDQFDDVYLINGGDLTLGKKRKDLENKHFDKDFGDPSSLKKSRVVWTFDLHQKFVKAVNQIGFDKVGPKKILDLMNVPWLTRENVASHLQKYRLYLSRLQKENDMKASFGGINESDPYLKDSAGNLGFHNQINMRKDDAANGNYGTSNNKIQLQNVDHKIHEADLKGIVSLPLKEPKKPQTFNVPEPQKISSSRMGINNSFGSLETEPKYAEFDSTLLTRYSWIREVSETKYQEQKPHLQLQNGFNNLPPPALQHHNKFNNLPPPSATNPTPFNKERDKPPPVEIQPSYAKSRHHEIRQLSPKGNPFDMLSLQPQSHVKSFPTSVPTTCPTLSMKNQGTDRTSVNSLESTHGNLIPGKDSAFIDTDLCDSLFQGDFCPVSDEFQNKKVLNYNDTELIAEVPAYLYDALKFDYEYPNEFVEFPVIIDQGLFIA